MIVINTSASKSFKVIPREYLTAFNIEVRDNLLNTKFTFFEDTVSTSGDYMQFTNSYVDGSGNTIFKEARYYDFDLFADFNFWNMNLNYFLKYFIYLKNLF